MGKITGTESMEKLPEKVLQMYEAVYQLIIDGEDMSSVTVSRITQNAGIGKGTAYDYFDSREEIIVCAIVCLMQKLSKEICTDLRRLPDFAAQMEYLLNKIEVEFGKQKCFWRFVHLLLDTSGISQQLKQKIEKEQMEQYLPLNSLRMVLQEDMDKEQIRCELPVDYVVYSVCAKMAVYVAYINNRSCSREDPRLLRPYIFRGLIDEFCQ